MHLRTKPRRIALSVITLAVSLGALWVALSRPGAFSAPIRWALQRGTGTQVEVVGGDWNGWGRLRVASIKVLAPEWPGRSAELFTVEGLDSSFNPLWLLWGELHLENLDIDRAALCVAQREGGTRPEDTNFNVLHPPEGKLGLSLKFRPERIRVNELGVENLAVSGDGKLLTKGQRVFVATLERTAGGVPGDLGMKLEEAEPLDATQRAAREPARPKPGGVRIEGTWNDRSFDYSARANRLDFRQSVRPLLPPALQESCRALGLAGTVTDISVRGSPAKPLAEASLQVRDLGVNLLDLGIPTTWEGFSEAERIAVSGRPRMSVASGTIVLRDDRLTLRDINGTLTSEIRSNRGAITAVPLPVRLTMELDFSGTPSPGNIENLDEVTAWFPLAMRHCGVSIDFEVPDFALRRAQADRPWAVQLPAEIVNILDNFRVRQGRITIAAKARRAVGAPDSPELPLKVEGTLRISDGDGAYVNFPYPLKDVQAEIGFEDDRLAVRSLEGKGSGNCTLAISGSVDGAGDDAGVDLLIRTKGEAPIDLPLQNAFEPGPRRMFELLFAYDLRERLVTAGLLKAEGSELGGHCQFSINVKRRRGERPVATTGKISVRDAQVLCSRFPYPIRVSKGVIDLEDEAIRLPREEWQFTTAGGGEGFIDGEIRIPRVAEGRDALPDLRLVVVSDHVNPLLLAAIPVENARPRSEVAKGWPGAVRSVAADAMQALGVSGEIAVDGRIGSDARGDTTLDMRVNFGNGRFRPANGPDRLLERVGIPWPEGFDLDEAKATLRLTERTATLLSLSARAGTGGVKASGAASLLDTDRSLHAELTGAPLGTWIVPLLPDAVQQSARAAWNRCAVEGTFDGDIVIRQRAGAPTERRAVLSTQGVRLVARGTPCELRVPCGHMAIDGPTLELVDVHVDALANGAAVGGLDANGAIALSPEGRQSLRGAWRLDSLAPALWPVMLEAANLPDIARLHDRWNPAGNASGEVTVSRSERHPIDWQVQVDDGALILGDPSGVPISIALDSGGRLGLGPGEISVSGAAGSGRPGLTGRLPGGAFSLDGALATGPGGPAGGGEMRLDFEVGPIDASVTNVLPDDLAAGLRHIELAAGQARSDDLRLLGWTPQAPAIGLQGGITLHDGSLNAGTRLSRVHARFGIDARAGRPQPVVIDLGGGHGTFVAKDRFFDDAAGTLLVNADAGGLRVQDLRASLYGGRAWADAQVGGLTRDWHLDVGVSGASLPSLIRGGTDTQRFADAGEVDGALSLGGELGVPDSLRGVGRIAARDARMAELPLTLRLLQATQLMLPLSDSLDRASIAFHLRDDQLRFERFDLTCPTLKLLGTGSMNLSDWTVALRFRNRGTVPLISDMFGAASDALFVIDVSGPAGDPAVKLTPLPPLGQDPSSQPVPPQVAAARTETP